MSTVRTFTAAVGLSALLCAGQSVAADAQGWRPQAKGTFKIDFRASGVVPSANDPIFTAAGVDTGLRAQVSDAVMPTLGFEYFVTDQLSVEAILTATQHDAFAVGGGTSTKVHSTWALPPVVSLRYHPLPRARVSPYVGAGANLMVYFAGQDFNGFKVRLKDEFGYAFQAGVDVGLVGPWSLNMDAKKVFTTTRATINDGALYSHVHLDPWVVSLGVGRRF